MSYSFKPQSPPYEANSRGTTHFYRETKWPSSKAQTLITVRPDHSYDDCGFHRPKHPGRPKIVLPTGAIPSSWHQEPESKKPDSILAIYDQLSVFIRKQKTPGQIKFIAGEFDEGSRTENDSSIKLSAELINRDRLGAQNFLSLRANAITVPDKPGLPYTLSCIFNVLTARPESGLKVNQRICGSAHISPELGDKIINDTRLTDEERDAINRSIRESMDNAVVLKTDKLRQVAIAPYRAGSGTGGQSSIVIR